MFKVLVLALGFVLVFSGAEAKNPLRYLNGAVEMQVAEDDNRFPISPSDAANIAKDAYPGSKVLNVRLLPSGIYAVTLREGGAVMRVMVDATSGAVS